MILLEKASPEPAPHLSTGFSPLAPSKLWTGAERVFGITRHTHDGTYSSPWCNDQYCYTRYIRMGIEPSDPLILSVPYHQCISELDGR